MVASSRTPVASPRLPGACAELSANAELVPLPPVHRGKEASIEAMQHSVSRVIEAK